MLKKIFPPIIYAAFFFPVIIGTIIIVGFTENAFGFMFDMAGMIEFPVIILIYGGFLFGIANVLIDYLEKPTKYSALMHLRQSTLYYAGLIGSSAWFMIPGDHGGLRGGLIAAIFVISAWAIIINALFLYIQSKSKKPVAN